MKRVCVIVFVLFIFSSFITTNVGAWEGGDSWSFRQVTDFSKYTKEDFLAEFSSSMDDYISDNMSYNTSRKVYEFNISGEEAFLFTVKYIGEENGVHRFDYKGGFYSRFDSKVHMRTWTNTSFMDEWYNKTIEYEGRMNIKEADIEFNGTLWAEKYTYQNKSYGVKKAWGINRQYVHSDTYLDADICWNGKENQTFKRTMMIDTVLNMDIDYSPRCRGYLYMKKG